MSQRRDHRHVPEEHRASEHLANERTFLAWVRTNIALMSFGFVLARIVPWLDEDKGGRAAASRLAAHTLPLGLGLMIFGAILTLLAAWRYDTVNREIETGLVKTDRALVWFVTIILFVLAGVLITYLLVIR